MYQTKQQKHALNRLLASAGLGALDNPMRLCNELASYVRDHEHFHQLLTAAQPETRRDMYESMKPYLAFHAKPLDAYMSESGALAEAQQLPTVDADGMLHPFNVPEIATQAADAPAESCELDRETAQAAVNEAFGRGHLILTCKKCTRTEAFPAVNKANAIFAARNAGWTYDEARGDCSETCPDCP
jgi:hypothetical protein